jgi:hypothetical protein
MKRLLLGMCVLGLLASVDFVPAVHAESGGVRELPTVERSGNWSRAASENPAQPSKKKSGSKKNITESAIPVPRAKPGSKAAKADAARAKKAKAAEAKKAKTVAAKKVKDGETDNTVPVPRKKQKPKAAAQAGLVPATGGDTSAPYRGNLGSDEIKEVLSGRVLSSRVDGKDARITLAEDGSLSWASSTGSGQGRWWSENGRVCDRYDPAGDFPGRGTGCRSFEQKSDGYYAGGRKLQFVN